MAVIIIIKTVNGWQNNKQEILLRMVSAVEVETSRPFKKQDHDFITQRTNFNISFVMIIYVFIGFYIGILEYKSLIYNLKDVFI